MHDVALRLARQRGRVSYLADRRFHAYVRALSAVHARLRLRAGVLGALAGALLLLSAAALVIGVVRARHGWPVWLARALAVARPPARELKLEQRAASDVDERRACVSDGDRVRVVAHALVQTDGVHIITDVCDAHTQTDDSAAAHVSSSASSAAATAGAGAVLREMRDAACDAVHVTELPSASHGPVERGEHVADAAELDRVLYERLRAVTLDVPVSGAHTVLGVPMPRAGAAAASLSTTAPAGGVAGAAATAAKPGAVAAPATASLMTSPSALNALPGALRRTDSGSGAVTRGNAPLASAAAKPRKPWER